MKTISYLLLATIIFYIVKIVATYFYPYMPFIYWLYVIQDGLNLVLIMYMINHIRNPT